MDLSGFSAFDFSEGVPYFSITQNGLTFNKAVVLKLGSPAFVRFLINEETHQVALQVCEESAPKAVAFYRPKKNGVLSVRWSSQDLVSTNVCWQIIFKSMVTVLTVNWLKMG